MSVVGARNKQVPRLIQRRIVNSPTANTQPLLVASGRRRSCSERASGQLLPPAEIHFAPHPALLSVSGEFLPPSSDIGTKFRSESPDLAQNVIVKAQRSNLWSARLTRTLALFIS
jgi:hypothetical protein